MCKALTELIEEGRAEGREEGREEGRAEGIRGMIIDNLEYGTSREQIVEKLYRYFGLNSDKAWEHLEKVMKSNT